MTLLCVSIFVHDLAQAKRDIARAVEAGADIVELRLDELGDATPVRQAIGDYTIPFILTCRPTWEGGSSELTDEERVRLLAEVAPSDPSVRVDLELKSIKKTGLAGIANDVIISAHDFKGRPEKLSNLLLELDASPGSISKIVWMARSIRDNLEAFEVLQHRSKPTIALCMGEAGLISRVLAKKFGGFLTFASLGASDATAPGQVSIADMKRLYRWDAIKPSTKVYGVVAQPVMHSMSPAIHNAGFEAVGHDGVYLPLLVNEGYESFKAFMESFVHFDGLDLSGLSAVIACRYDDEPGSPWTFFLYVDERGDARQREALVGILTGRLGGSALEHFPWAWKASHFLGWRAARIDIDHTPGRGWFRAGGRVEMRVRGPVEDQAPVTCVIPGHERAGVEHRADLLRVDVAPLSYELSGRCAYESTFEYSSDGA